MLSCICNLKLKTLTIILALGLFFYLISQAILRFISAGNSLPILIWWTPFMPDGYRTVSCSDGLYKCLVTNNRSLDSNANIGAYLFYGSHIENHDFPLPRNNTIIWAIFHEESPKNYAPFLFNEVQRLFNVSATFSRHSDVPITLHYLTDLHLLTETKYYVPVNVKNQQLNRISPVLYIQSDCDTPINRDFLVKELGKYVKIDSYGKCLKNKTFPKELINLDPLDLYNEELLKFMSQYKFTIAFENSICEDYITEKLWKPLIAGSIPIYLGSPSIGDWLPNKNSAILAKDFKMMKNLGDYINEINKNDSLYDSFLEHKLYSRISNALLKENLLDDDPVPVFECSVCEKVYKNKAFHSQLIRNNVYNCPKPTGEGNTWGQHWDIGKCQAKTLKLLISRNKPYTSELFEEMWKKFLYERNC